MTKVIWEPVVPDEVRATVEPHLAKGKGPKPVTATDRMRLPVGARVKWLGSAPGDLEGTVVRHTKCFVVVELDRARNGSPLYGYAEAQVMPDGLVRIESVGGSV